MQTKGLMEVIVLSIMIDAGLIGMEAFSALVAMALVTTAVTMPLTRWIVEERPSPVVTKDAVTR